MFYIKALYSFFKENIWYGPVETRKIFDLLKMIKCDYLYYIEIIFSDSRDPNRVPKTP